MKQWRKDIAQWRIGKTLYLSVPFTWLLPRAKKIAKGHNVGPVVVGGPAVDLLPEYISHSKVARIGIGEGLGVNPLMMHNPLATFTTRGCPRRCEFCAVPKIEGDFRELDDWPVRPVVCDNNLLASSRKHFDRVIKKLRVFDYVDFNQGLDARLFTLRHADRLTDLRGVKVRFSFDHVRHESTLFDAVQKAQCVGLRDIGVYVLIGFNDTPDDALYRLELVRSWGIRPNPMRYQPLYCLEKNSHVADAWTDFELRRMMKYYSRLRWLGHIPYDDFRPDDLPLFQIRQDSY